MKGNYENGKIYKLISNNTEKIYIGATTQLLCKTLSKHKSDYNKWCDNQLNYITSYDIFEHGDVEIVLLKEYPCENKEQLDKKKRKYIDKYECVNKRIPGSICKHNNQRNTCKDCTGKSKCDHNRIKSICKDCKGGSICQHNKIKNVCVDCNGDSSCKHKKVKYICIECKGSQICDHNRRRSTCKDCNGKDRCDHNKIKNTCKECKGKYICVHNKIKRACKDCNGCDTIKVKCPVCDKELRKSFMKTHINNKH